MINKRSLICFLLCVCVISFSFNYRYNDRSYNTALIKKDTSLNVIGRYNSPKQESNKFTSESLILKADSTFEYFLNTEFTKIKSSGYWKVSGRSIILNSEKKTDKIIVEETFAKRSNRSQILFDVTYKDDNPLYYQLYLIYGRDTLHYNDVYHDTAINHNGILRSFYIVDARGFKYPKYFLKSSRSNHFRIKLEVDRIFDNEKWRMKNDKLQPIGLDGNYASYYLIKEAK